MHDYNSQSTTSSVQSVPWIDLVSDEESASALFALLSPQGSLFTAASTPSEPEM
jgi:hypothetical protein